MKKMYLYLQNKVFGPGYPSLPTMTQEEYFEKELREGKIVTEYRLYFINCAVEVKYDSS